jgi:hypothetical protein
VDKNQTGHRNATTLRMSNAIGRSLDPYGKCGRHRPTPPASEYNWKDTFEVRDEVSENIVNSRCE